VQIDFSASASRDTYADREADDSWRDAVRAVVDPAASMWSSASPAWPARRWPCSAAAASASPS
jgi:hypothetical protein